MNCYIYSKIISYIVIAVICEVLASTENPYCLSPEAIHTSKRAQRNCTVYRMVHVPLNVEGWIATLHLQLGSNQPSNV